jgi:phosphomannomutase
VPPLYLGQRKIPCANEKKEALKKAITANPSVFGTGTANVLDGLRMDFGSSWILVRPSGTEPIFRIIAESPSEVETEKLLEDADKTLRKMVGI